MLKKFEGLKGQVEVLRKLPVDGQKNSLQEAAREHDQRQQLAVLHTSLLLGGFRKSDADDPEIFSRAIEHVLARYDVEIQREVTNPGRWMWPPTAYELREACERIANEQARAKEREERIRKQLEERRRLDALQAERKPLLTYHARDSPSQVPRAEQERREAEQILARYEAAAKASARPPAASSVFELNPDDWNA
jgi:hypothetical protein